MVIEEFSYVEKGAPFNMAIATLMSIRQTLDHIRNIEAEIKLPPEERQRIKVELVKKFYVDACPLLLEKYVKKYDYVLNLEPFRIMSVNPATNKGKVKVKYSQELNLKLDIIQRDIQIALQDSGKYYMPPGDDMSTIAGKMG